VVDLASLDAHRSLGGSAVRPGKTSKPAPSPTKNCHAKKTPAPKRSR
jgi:hypothetical protein